MTSRARLTGYFAIAAITGATCLVLRGCDYVYSVGDRTGVISKISFKGNPLEYKSWEGQLAMDGFSSAAFNFSVKDPAVVKQLQGAQEKGARVRLRYTEVLLRNSFTEDTDYTITEVKELPPAAHLK